MKQSHLYTIGRYGTKEIAFNALADRFYRESTGAEEIRNPHTVENLRGYTPPISKKKNDSNEDYKIKQLDYWLKHTKIVKLPWYKRIRLIKADKLVWIK